VKKFQRIALAAFVTLGLGASLTACFDDDADVASENISKDADNFKVNRRIVAINSFTDKYLLTIEGWCNITDSATQLEVVCKVDGGYKKHFVGKADNVAYVVEQLDAHNVSVDHYKVTFKPSTVMPDVEAR
jgi:hypothetical protein